MNTADNQVPVPNIIERIHQHNVLGQITPPGKHFNADRVCFYTGMQLEELGEKIEHIAMGHVVQEDRDLMLWFSRMLAGWGKQFKQGKHYGAVLRADREKLLDDDIDQIVVSIGSMVYQTPHFAGAVEEVLKTLEAKAWPDGKFHHDENGKMVKPAGWNEPNLLPFIDPPADDGE